MKTNIEVEDHRSIKEEPKEEERTVEVVVYDSHVCVKIKDATETWKSHKHIKWEKDGTPLEELEIA